MQNPMQMMSQLNDFMNGFQGDPKRQAMQLIQQSNMNQRQLNKLQTTANNMYAMAKKVGIIR